MKSRRVVLGLLICVLACSSPTKPPQALPLQSFRYVRTLPVVNSTETRVMFDFEYQSWSCYGCISSSGRHVEVSSLARVTP